MIWLNLIILHFTLLVLLHSAACWVIPNVKTIAAFFIIGILIGVNVIMSFYKIWGFSIELAAGVMTYAFACELYIFVFGLVATSISVSILLRACNGDLKLDDLITSYCGSVMVESRLKRLHESGLVITENNEIELTTKGLSTIKRFNQLHKFFNLRELSFMPDST